MRSRCIVQVSRVPMVVVDLSASPDLAAASEAKSLLNISFLYGGVHESLRHAADLLEDAGVLADPLAVWSLLPAGSRVW